MLRNACKLKKKENWFIQDKNQLDQLKLVTFCPAHPT
jgi:hypothetical protein